MAEIIPWGRPGRDHERTCCDGRCDENQGRGGCPRVPASMPVKRAPRIPRVVCRPEPAVAPVFRFVFAVIVCVLCAAAIVNLAAVQAAL